MKLLPIAVNPVIAACYRDGLNTALAVLDAQLAGDGFLTGTAPTIADLACYGDVMFAQMSGFATEQWPNVAGWAGRLAKLDGFASPLDLLPMSDARIGTSP